MKRRTFFQMLLALAGVPLLPKAVAKLDAIPVATTLNPGYIPGPPGPLIGCIQPFVGDIPEGWLPCDGRTITKSAYSELWQVLGCSEPSFEVPDMRPAIPSLQHQGEEWPQAWTPSEPYTGVQYIIKAKDKVDLCLPQQAVEGGSNLEM